MLLKSLKYLVSLLISIYLFKNISKEIFINVDKVKVLLNSPSLLILIIILFIPIFYLLTKKLIFLVKDIKIIGFKESFSATLIAYTYNLFLPAKSGDLFRHKFLGLEISFKNFLNINIIEKIISLLVLVLFVLIGFYSTNIDTYHIFGLNNLFVYLILIFLIILITIFLLNLSKQNKKFFFLKLFIFDFFIWLLQFLQIFFIIKVLNININLFETIFIFGISIIIGLVPISIGGFGVRDYIIFLFFSNLALEADLFSVLLLFNLRYILPVIVSLFFSFINIYNTKN